MNEMNYIDPKAKIGKNCKIFPFVYIEGDVVIGDDCIIFPFTSILNGTRLGNKNKIHQGAVIGALPQDFDFRGEKSELIIGDNNVFRENVVVNRATHRGCQTVIGNDNFFMEGAHISHDTKVGNNCVFGYGTKIAGNCEISNGAVFSSSVIANPGARVGEGVLVQAGCTFSKDIPPYIICTRKAEFGGVNTVRCQQFGVDEKTLKHIANAYRLIFHGMTSVFDSVKQVEEQVPDSKEIRNIVNFVSNTKLGIIQKI